MAVIRVTTAIFNGVATETMYLSARKYELLLNCIMESESSFYLWPEWCQVLLCCVTLCYDGHHTLSTTPLMHQHEHACKHVDQRDVRRNGASQQHSGLLSRVWEHDARHGHTEIINIIQGNRLVEVVS